MNVALQRLKQQLKTARQRAVFVFAPESPDKRNELLKAIEQMVPDAIWFSDGDTRHKAVHRYRDALGQNHQQLVLDFQQLIHADALAAITGTVAGGGCIWLILPPQKNAFYDRFLASISSYDQVILVQQWKDLAEHLKALTHLKLPASEQPSLPSDAQQTAIDAMTAQPTITHLIVADRGRGKSTCLGLAIKQAGYHQQAPILVTASHPHAVATLIDHAAGGAQFRAWDRLLRDTSSYGSQLVIDEAAAIPLHILKLLQQHYRVWAVATTIDGYEGCGKGFALRFLTWLQDHTDCRQHRLEQPLRWSTADAVEPWLNELLLLKHPSLVCPPTPLAQYRWHYRHASELAEPLLHQVMTLLLEAHYQSSPNDLRLLLDDPKQMLGLVFSADDLVGVCWVAYEGPLDKKLHEPVLCGQRRIKGELLPQAIGFYRQQPQALNWRWLRIVRIAAHPQLRRHGIASYLLEQLAAAAKNDGIDAIGSSFGVTQEVEEFWRSSTLREIRRGEKKNMASGVVSAIWAVALRPEVHPVLNQLQRLQQAEQDWLQGKAPSTKLAIDDVIIPLLLGFTRGYLPFSNSRFAWWYLLHHRGDHATLKKLGAELFRPNVTSSELAQIYQASSRFQFEQQLRHTISHYLNEHGYSD